MVKPEFKEFMEIYLKYRDGNPPFRPAYAYYRALEDARRRGVPTPSFTAAKRYELAMRHRQRYEPHERDRRAAHKVALQRAACAQRQWRDAEAL